MEASTEQLVAVSALLHSRGREATPAQVRQWLAKMNAFEKKTGREQQSESSWCNAVLAGHKTATMCLHLHFGDAL